MDKVRLKLGDLLFYIFTRFSWKSVYQNLVFESQDGRWKSVLFPKVEPCHVIMRMPCLHCPTYTYVSYQWCYGSWTRFQYKVGPVRNSQSPSLEGYIDSLLMLSQQEFTSVSGMYHVEFWRFTSVSANISVLIFIVNFFGGRCVW